MKKKMLALILALITLLAVCPLSVFAAETYIIENYDEGTTGFTYIYDQPSTSKGTNMGKMTTGTPVYAYREIGEWLYVTGRTKENKKVYGYIIAEDATPEDEYPARKPQQKDNIYVIEGRDSSYCYCYDQANSVSGKNLGRFNNGYEVTYLGKKGNWYKVKGVNTKGKTITGYIHNYCAVPYSEYYGVTDEERYETWEIDCTSRDKKYCYIYDKKSSSTGKNLGSLNNGTVVYLIDYDTSWLYIKAKTGNGKTVKGYIASWCAHPDF